MSEDKINKYNHGKIYTIRCRDDNNLIYVGSTVQPLYKRWDQHKRKIKNENDKEYNKLLYIKMRELGIDNFYIELYENFNCECHEQLLKREGEIIRQIATLNKFIAGRTMKEYFKDNKEQLQEQKKLYRNNNKKKIIEQQKQYYNENKEKIIEYHKHFYNINKEKIIEQQKQYNNINKEKIIEQQKQYYNENKEKILEQNKQNYIENKEQIKEKRKQFYEVNKEKILEQKKQYYKLKKQQKQDQLKGQTD
jgi:hypothetical protein